MADEDKDDDNSVYIEGAKRLREEVSKQAERWDHFCSWDEPMPKELKADPAFHFADDFARMEMSIGGRMFYHWVDSHDCDAGDVFVFDDRTMRRVSEDGTVDVMLVFPLATATPTVAPPVPEVPEAVPPPVVAPLAPSPSPSPTVPDDSRERGRLSRCCPWFG